MKHLKKGRKFGREIGQRRAMLKILTGELLLREKISTTEAKAKELQGIAEKIIRKMKLSSGKEKGDRVSALRTISAQLPKNISVKRIGEIAAHFSKRKSGFTRIIKTGQRRSDGAKTAIIELVKDNA